MRFGQFIVILALGMLAAFTACGGGSRTTPIKTTPALAAGNYVFYISGEDANNSVYFAAGVFTVNGSGVITSGEQDFSDATFFSRDAISSGTVVTTGDSNLQITLQTGDSFIGPGGQNLDGTGAEVLNVAKVSSSKFLINEYDTWASASGEMNLQTSTSALCASASSDAPCGYVFNLSGLDSGDAPAALGGVIAVDSVGGISGTGSVLDLNDDGNLSTAQSLTASTVTSPDTFGVMSFALNSSAFPGGGDGVVLDGFVIDANHIRFIENGINDNFAGITGGTAIGQTGTGNFSKSSISGSSYVISAAGSDTVIGGPLQTAALIAFRSDGSVSGNLSFNDFADQTPQGGSALVNGDGAYAVEPTGRVTVSNITDGNNSSVPFAYNFEFYLTGDGHALLISMDANDIVGGLGYQQAASTFTASSLSGNYAVDSGQIQLSSGGLYEADAVGTLTANGSSTLTGFIDENNAQDCDGGSLEPNQAVSLTYATTSTNGIFTVTDPSSGSDATLYLVDPTQGWVISNDATDLNLIYFDLQQ
jgi:hypothetical protein